MRRAARYHCGWFNGREWRLKDMSLHRHGGPAIEEDDGSKNWFWKGEIIYADDSEGNENVCARYSFNSKYQYNCGKRRRRDHAKAKFWAPGYEKLKT